MIVDEIQQWSPEKPVDLVSHMEQQVQPKLCKSQHNKDLKSHKIWF